MRLGVGFVLGLVFVFGFVGGVVEEAEAFLDQWIGFFQLTEETITVFGVVFVLCVGIDIDWFQRVFNESDSWIGVFRCCSHIISVMANFFCTRQIKLKRSVGIVLCGFKGVIFMWRWTQHR